MPTLTPADARAILREIVGALTIDWTSEPSIGAAIEATEADPRGAAALAVLGDAGAPTWLALVRELHGRPGEPRRTVGRPPLPPEARRVRVAGTVDPEIAEWAVTEAAARDAAAAREGQRGRGLSGVIEDALSALRGPR